MVEEKGPQSTPQEAAEAADTFRFIRRVMTRTRERVGDYAAIRIWWGVLILLAILAIWLFGRIGLATVGLIAALWAARRLIGRGGHGHCH